MRWKPAATLLAAILLAIAVKGLQAASPALQGTRCRPHGQRFSLQGQRSNGLKSRGAYDSPGISLGHIFES